MWFVPDLTLIPEMLESVDGLSVTHSLTGLYCLLPDHRVHGLHNRGTRRSQPALPLRVFHDISGNACSEHDHVLFHRHGKAGQRSASKPSRRRPLHSAYKEVQSQSLSTSDLGNSAHDGDSDSWRGRGHARPSTVRAYSSGGGIALFQPERILERSKVHDRAQ